jgi:hypothetical protein
MRNHFLRSTLSRPIVSNVTGLSYVASTSIDRASSSTAFTFSNVNIGTANTNRVIILGVGGFRSSALGALGTLTSVTIGGVNATRIITQLISTYGAVHLFALAVPTGTTANIVVSHGNAETCAIGVYSLITTAPSIDATRASSGVQTSTTLTTASATIDTGTNSAIVGFIYGVNNGSTTWTNLTENFDIDTRSSENFSGASGYPYGSTGSTTISATKLTGTNTGIGMVVARWD